MGILDVLFPKKCVNCRKNGEYLCPECFSWLSFDVQMICLECNKGSIDGKTHPFCKKRKSIDGVFSGVAYTRVVRKLLYTFKYSPYIADLGDFLANLLYESLIQQQVFMHVLQKSSPVFVPIPLSDVKNKKRGYNQAAVLAQHLGKKLRLPLAYPLIRVKNTASQYTLKREERIQNIKDAFAMRKNQDNIPETVFLVDDVLTSGTTLSEATKVLKQSGVKNVWGVTFARD